METSGGRGVWENFAGAFVEHALNRAERLLSDGGEVGATGQVVTEAIVLALAGGALPGAVGVAKVDRELEVGLVSSGSAWLSLYVGWCIRPHP